MAGHGALVLLFQNTSASSCLLYGYPGLDALRPFGRAIASATVEWLNFDPPTTGSCEFSAKIGVTAPNTTRIVRMPGEVSGCQLQVHATVAGSSGRN
jgi:hypothetical protein